MENDGKMSVERSLEIISGAIELGHRDVERNAGTPMIMWGVLMSVTGCLVWLLWKLTGNSHWNMLWFAACAVGWIAYGLVQRKDHKERKPLTYVWKIIRLVWTVFGLLALAVAVVGSLSLDGSVYGASLPIVAVMILLLMLASSVTAYVLKSNVYGIFIGANIIFVNYALMYPGPSEALCLALSIITLLVFPGIIINKKARKDN